MQLRIQTRKLRTQRQVQQKLVKLAGSTHENALFVDRVRKPRLEMRTLTPSAPCFCNGRTNIHGAGISSGLSADNLRGIGAQLSFVL